ncbi:50S ribosomal protein L28 [Candidatus Curtissbacteria bacterium]|nr:50S ribosomal protein L28 [Candidatus Curtissbacteria bacterium]MBI2599159.1 50S ribosomal protein L28 [Candidatus Curtissbacteria bacterium]
MRACQICGKKSLIQKSGAHNYGGGWAYRAQKTRFVSEVNLHATRVTYQGVRKTMRLCTKCLRVVKAEMAKNPVKKYVKAPEVTAAPVAA